ncbi:ribosome silencing factor [Halanaerobium congolense]|jgi:ribosome-associated protein|uniref:Ribosomal silencing factor RsfS n=1 Tax=Halanaerobium congolense TaxID=54121 RepID=A0A1G6KB55_9FIRM|nr:ribosome silencing factor [Halanaerobium congolense]KXS50039.1 MAG: ribosome-associated protein [Halanaerobium sp. T82-1]OEG63487.1 MAG: ribosome silencing factor [Halanaerobium sp. MDAL1]PUU91980.1 MAG: ribosome-associated protein [Halanaerobium sp.]PTX17670.1 ribosome-associated protein [Halanaerobium congolense]PXV66716.1 ribosome-associated protein [Halanaerobium congolense]
MSDLSIKDIALMAADAADDKKAEDIEILNVQGLTVIADYFVLCSGNSDQQVRAIARAVDEKLSEKEIEPKKMAGMNDAKWILIDYADVIVHVFQKREREYYDLERLWSDAEKILRTDEKEE